MNPYYYLQRRIERIGIWIWQARHHDEIVQSLQEDLDRAEAEILRLQQKIATLQQKVVSLQQNVVSLQEEVVR